MGGKVIGVIAILVGALMVWAGVKGYKLGPAFTGQIVSQ